MTMFFLNSGAEGDYPARAKSFYEKVFAGLTDEVCVLWCFFARGEEDTSAAYHECLAKFQPFLPAALSYAHVHASNKCFAEETADADVIILRGGHTKTLLTALQKYNLQRLFKDKIVVGSSAGSNVLCEHYWSPGARELGDGFGLVPVKFISHYGSQYGSDDLAGPIDWEKARNELITYGDPDLPIYAPEEGDFEVVER